jgi:hypothetical protein
MCKKYTRVAFLFLLTFLTVGFTAQANALVKGIYLTQSTMEDTKYLKYLIDHSKAVGISTFVVDLEAPSKLYAKNIQLLKDNGIHYVARIVVFPQGGHADQISSPAYWEKRYKLVADAVSYGADQIQLDYIRYNTKQPASSDNAKNIVKVVQFFKDRLHIPLQADVFGISSYGESKHIAEMKAVSDAGADGYYVWSAHNKYDYLFDLLGELQKQSPAQQQKTMQAGVDQSTKVHVKMDIPKVADNMDSDGKTKAIKESMNDDETPWAHAGTEGVEMSPFPAS